MQSGNSFRRKTLPEFHHGGCGSKGDIRYLICRQAEQRPGYCGLDHQMESIELLEHENGRGTPAEAILDQMVQNQTTAVDAVSGATCSSKVIRKAVENALAEGHSG